VAINDLCKIIKDAVFPRFCFGCKKEGSLLCDDCFVFWQPDLLKIDEQNKLIYFWQYADVIARELICAWKYDYDSSAWEIIQRKLSPSLAGLRHFSHIHEIEAIIPVELHKRKMCERGFDQAVMISEFLGAELEIPVVRVLKRVRSTGQQAERSESDRVEYMKDNPFIVKSLLQTASVLLVDDVFTTGATINAASEVLKKHGVTSIWRCTLAKG